MPIGNRGLQGQPILPYADFKAMAGSDVFFTLAFLDHVNSPVVPTSLSYEIDDLTNSLNLVPLTQVTPLPTTSTAVVQIPGSQWTVAYAWEGSVICQVSWTFTAVDSITGNSFTATAVNIVELCAIQVPG